MRRIRIYIAGLLTGVTLLVTAGCKVDNRFDLNNLDTESTVLKGTHLNQSQGLEFRNLILSLPDGIQVKKDKN